MASPLKVGGDLWSADSALKHLKVSTARHDKPLLLPVQAIKIRTYASVVRYGDNNVFIDELWYGPHHAATIRRLEPDQLEFEIFACRNSTIGICVGMFIRSVLWDAYRYEGEEEMHFTGGRKLYQRIKSKTGRGYRQIPSLFQMSKGDYQSDVFFLGDYLSNQVEMSFVYKYTKGGLCVEVFNTLARRRVSMRTRGGGTVRSNAVTWGRGRAKSFLIEKSVKFVQPIHATDVFASATHQPRIVIDDVPVEPSPMKDTAQAHGPGWMLAPALFYSPAVENSKEVRIPEKAIDDLLHSRKPVYEQDHYGRPAQDLIGLLQKQAPSHRKDWMLSILHGLHEKDPPSGRP